MNIPASPAVVIKSTLYLIVTGAMLPPAAPNKPVIDTQGVDMARFEADRAKCEEVALQVE